MGSNLVASVDHPLQKGLVVKDIPHVLPVYEEGPLYAAGIEDVEDLLRIPEGAIVEGQRHSAGLGAGVDDLPESHTGILAGSERRALARWKR